MVNRGKSMISASRLSRRARKLAEALAAQSELPPSEMERLAGAQEAFERRQRQVLARLGKEIRASADRSSPKKGYRRSSKSATSHPK